MASHADLALILHDEVDPMGNRLSGAFDAAYRVALIELSALCPISLENATNNNDIKWFWQTYTRPSITLDLGHLEASALDPVGFVGRLEDELLQRVEFVHLHRTNGLRRGSETTGADRGLSRARGGTPPDRAQTRCADHPGSDRVRRTREKASNCSERCGPKALQTEPSLRCTEKL